MDESAARTELAERLRQAVESAPSGVLPFEVFMQRALYEPDLGYYEQSPGRVGRTGDFYTSVSVGPLFGELLAHQFAAWLSALDFPPCLVEAGAHDGRLAQDILGWLRSYRPALFERLTYCVVEPSTARRKWQAERLGVFDLQLRWTDTMPTTRGIIFSNELLDAFPVRPVRWNARDHRWWEVGVGWDTGRFIEVPFSRRPDTPAPEVPESLQAVLPDGFTTESSPAAESWWRHAADSLQAGFLITMDYGLTADEFLMPQRQHGTCRGYRQHFPVTDLLANPGACDLTAHVNFSRIQSVGEQVGLSTLELATQSVCLTEILRQTLAAPDGFGPWNPARNRQFQTLTHPEHLGRSFRWLVQGRLPING